MREIVLDTYVGEGPLDTSAEDWPNFKHIYFKVCEGANGHLDSIHDPFFTSKTRGAGLGLTMVHQIMMNHHGEITFESQIGKGTSVTLYLPVKR